MEIAVVQQQDQKEQVDHDTAMMELGALLEADKKRKDFEKQNQQGYRGEMSMDEEKKLKKLINNRTSKATDEEKDKARLRIKVIQEKRKKFRVRNNGHSIENVKELVQVLEMVNTTDNPDIEAVGKRMGKVFEKFTGDNVKTDPKLRKEAIDASKSMLKDMQDIGIIKTG